MKIKGSQGQLRVAQVLQWHENGMDFADALHLAQSPVGCVATSKRTITPIAYPAQTQLGIHPNLADKSLQ